MSSESPSELLHPARAERNAGGLRAGSHRGAPSPGARRRRARGAATGTPRSDRRYSLLPAHSRSAFVVVPRRPIRAPLPRINHHQGGQEAAPRRDHGGPRRYDPPRSTADISCAGAKERPPRVKGGPTSSQTTSGRDDHPDVGVGPRVVFFSLLARTNNGRREAMLSRLRSADRPRDSPTPPHAARASDRAPCAIGYTVA